MGRSTPKSSGVRYDAKVKDRVLRLARDEVPVSEIKRRLGAKAPSKRTIRMWMAEADPPIARQGNPRVYNREAILQDLKTMTRTEVREKHGCSNKYLTDLINGEIAP